MSRTFLLRLKALEEWLQDQDRVENFKTAQRVEKIQGLKHVDFIYVKRANLSLTKIGSEKKLSISLPFASFSVDDSMLDSFDDKPAKFPRLIL